MYSDDTQLYIAFKPLSATINKYNMDHLHVCIDDIQKWMCTSMLKLNEDKAEFIISGTWQQLQKATDICVNITDKTFQSANSVHNLGYHIN